MDNTHVVNVYIHDKDLPDPKDLAAKYDVDYEPSEDEEEELKPTNDSFDENVITREISQQTTTNERIDSLVNKLDSKNREIERLCVLLEAVSVVPGADPSKYVDIIDENGEEVAVSLPLLLLACLNSKIGLPRH